MWPSDLEADALGMLRRMAIAALWFVSIFCLHELAWSLFGSPRMLGIVAGGLAAAVIFFDPFRVFDSGSSGDDEAHPKRHLALTERSRVTR